MSSQAKPKILDYADVLSDRSGHRRKRQEALARFGPRVVRAAEILEALAAQQDRPRPLSVPRRVFISYRWGQEDEDEWVLNLARELENRHNVVIFDKLARVPDEESHIARLVGRIAECHLFLMVIDPEYVVGTAGGEHLSEQETRTWSRSSEAPWIVLERGWVYDEYQISKVLLHVMRIRGLGFLRSGDRVPHGMRIAGPRRPGNVFDVRTREKLELILDHFFSLPGALPSEELASLVERLLHDSAQAAHDGEVEDAHRMALEAASLLPDLPDPHLRLAVACLRSGRFREAFESAQRAMALDPTYLPHRYLFALTACEVHENERAMGVAGDLTDVDPLSWRVHLVLAATLASVGQPVAAIGHLRAARLYDFDPFSALSEWKAQFGPRAAPEVAAHGASLPLLDPHWTPMERAVQISQVRDGRLVDTYLSFPDGCAGQASAQDLDRVLATVAVARLSHALDKAGQSTARFRCSQCEAELSFNPPFGPICDRCGALLQDHRVACSYCGSRRLSLLAALLHDGWCHCPYCVGGELARLESS